MPRRTTALLLHTLVAVHTLPLPVRYVASHLGQQFTESPSSALPDILADSGPLTPIIFVLSPGADPTSALIRCGGVEVWRVPGAHDPS